MDGTSEYKIERSVSFLKRLKQETFYLFSQGVSVHKTSEIINAIFDKTEELKSDPLRNQECEFIPTKTKIYRRFFIYNYRIVYKIVKSEVQILGLVHTSQSPSQIRKIRGRKV